MYQNSKETWSKLFPKISQFNLQISGCFCKNTEMNISRSLGQWPQLYIVITVILLYIEGNISRNQYIAGTDQGVFSSEKINVLPVEGIFIDQDSRGTERKLIYTMSERGLHMSEQADKVN